MLEVALEGENAADGAAAKDFMGPAVGGQQPLVVTDHQKLSGGLGGFHHPAGVLEIQGHGLFAQHMLAGLRALMEYSAWV